VDVFLKHGVEAKFKEIIFLRGNCVHFYLVFFEFLAYHVAWVGYSLSVYAMFWHAYLHLNKYSYH